MASGASSLTLALPSPKYTGEDEAPAVRQRGPHVIGPNQVDAATSQLILRKSASGPPPYLVRERTGWQPRSQEDFGGGGAFPEIHVAQYPLDMGKPTGPDDTKNNALAVTFDSQGKIDYGAIARQGHGANRIIHTSFKDLIPLRHRADAGEIDLSRPSKEEVAATTEKTKNALATLISGAVASQKPKNVNTGRKDPTFVKYTPANQMGNTTRKQDRIMKIVERQRDPMEPPKFKHKKIPRGPNSPPPPVMHSPPRKLTAADQEMWRIPPPVSNWKNPKGFTVPLDKRVAANGQGLQDVSINPNHASFAEALWISEKHARQEVKERSEMQRRLAEKEKAKKEESLQKLAQKAREDRARVGRRRDSRSRSRSESSSESGRSDDEDVDMREREQARRERRREEERKLRQSKMGAERRIQVMAKEQDRDISERIALGLAKPTQSKETMYDARLFNQSSGFNSGFNEDNHYDKPLFEAQNAIADIYRARGNAGEDDDEETGDKEMAKIQKAGRFGDALGKGIFKGVSDVEAREGPVQFEKEAAAADPFNVDKFLNEIGQGSTTGKRSYGLQEGTSQQSKRARVDNDED